MNVAKAVEEQVVIIDGIPVKQDKDGRYCLNDVHKASGGVLHKQPAKFFENHQAKDLISEIGEFSKVTVRGRSGGTYAVRELVYAYAMWISPEYHLKVIRAYDGLATQGVAVHENKAQELLDNPLKYFELLMNQAKGILAEKERLEAEAAINAPKVEFVDNFVTSGCTYTFREVAKMLNVKEALLRKHIVDNKLMYKLNTAWYPYQVHINSGLFEVKVHVNTYGQQFTMSKFTAPCVRMIAMDMLNREIAA
jgi:phage antirepressor YoqD-like protein